MGRRAFILFWLAAAIAMDWEWQKLLGEERARPRVVIGAAALAVACAFAAQNGPDFALFVLIAGALAVGALAGRPDCACGRAPASSTPAR